MRNLLFLAQVILLLLTMSEQDSDEEQLFSQNTCPSGCPSLCSQKLANKTPAPLIAHWHAEKSLTTLHSHSIQVPHHKELSEFLLENVSEISLTPSTSTPSAGRKVTAKRKNCSCQENS